MKTTPSRWLALLCVITLATGCSDDAAKPTPTKDMSSAKDMRIPLDMDSPKDQGRDLQSTPDQGKTQDQSADQDMRTSQDMRPSQDMNTPQDMASAKDLGDDMTAQQDMAASQDMSNNTPDMPPAPTRPRGQCKVSADCGNAELSCQSDAVGGTCLGPCAACDDIPGPDTYSCRVGACVRDCDKDEDCELGRTCSRNLCVVQRCTNNVCPTPQFACSAPDGICVRASCAQGQSCPAGTTCDRGLCMEP